MHLINLENIKALLDLHNPLLILNTHPLIIPY